MNQINILDLIQPTESDIIQYFGKIRNGKTYIATSDVLALLRRGFVVYANWPIYWNGYDERTDLFCRILGFLGLKRKFYNFPKENLKYLPVDENFFKVFPTLTDCYVFLDEGHTVFNSYEMANMNLAKQASILHTAHFNRSIRIISQRPNNVHVQMRANVNVFVQCQKVFSFMGIRMFRKTFYEDMVAGDTVDLDSPSDSSLYFGRKAVYNAYDTKYLRGSTPASQVNLAQLWRIPWREQVSKLFPPLKAHPPLPRGEPARAEAQRRPAGT